MYQQDRVQGPTQPRDSKTLQDKDYACNLTFLLHCSDNQPRKVYRRTHPVTKSDRFTVHNPAEFFYFFYNLSLFKRPSNKVFFSVVITVINCKKNKLSISLILMKKYFVTSRCRY